MLDYQPDLYIPCPVRMVIEITTFIIQGMRDVQAGQVTIQSITLICVAAFVILRRLKRA